MPQVSRSALVPHSASQMYDLVNDIDAYPSFVPWCVRSTSELTDLDQKQATLFFARGAIKTSFTTQNQLQQNSQIEMRLVDGPFKSLEGVWTFTDIGEEGSKVNLELEYELSNRMLKIALEAFFNQICDKLVNAFVQQAAKKYR